MKERFKFIPAVYLVLMNNDKILLLRRYNTGYADGQYSMIAGHLEGNETLRAATIREAKEEADITIKPENLKLVHTMHLKSEIKDSSDDERVTFYFTASEYEGTPKNLEPNKCDDISWHSIHTLPSNIIPHVKLALENIRNDIDYSEFGW